MFRKLLVANRGEIALRVVRACRELGIRSVAIYSEVDRNALHVRHADEAYFVGPAPARESYLNIPRIIEIAKAAGADAIHPGYGFLSENPQFAQACQEAGITFVGPPPHIIRAMGDKIHARQLMRDAGIPVIPGTGELMTAEEATEAATRIGFPIMVKAAAGGGGKGMRTVLRPEELPTALELARREAASAFGSGALYLEKFLQPVRHIEVQVIADAHGNVVALGERECSIQRRHQKMIEEAPSTAVSPEQRQRLVELARKAVSSIGYRSVGTLEFLLDQEGNIYFLEMNTRLQVEHPVTEMVTGVDLVADQILVAAGEQLPYRQEDVHIRGWAIECRVSAEDPFNDFLPSVGTVTLVNLPGGPGIRVDSAIYEGMEVTYHYDPLLAKVIAWGRHRQEAIARMRRALGEFKVVGISTNIPFHLQVMEDPQFIAGSLDTSYVERRKSTLPRENRDEQMAIMLAAVLAGEQRISLRPGLALQGWRLRGRGGRVNIRDWWRWARSS
mgnify:CR=1 FL=1